MKKYTTREGWLRECIKKLTPMFEEVGAKIPDRVRVTMSYLSAKTSGQVYPTEKSGDHSYEILIKIDEDRPEEIVGTLIHELVHAAVGVEEGHKGEFKRVALALGLEGKMSATTSSTELLRKIRPIIEELGPFPHAALDLTKMKKQTTRMNKVECQACGYTVRVAKKWLEVGIPHCPKHGRMTLIETETTALETEI